eukprot:CAMPEP_0170539480 /NCGR_PEP_ID=MMETSP0209-20121228/103959_1 /TAXON_ID=665100 ORGANISM="Litonotus pictus, Strain P1" /NCGR_SAMPLE_ID=MMETSP0209 /ASSEMBLY_ACC=CAM_ASM_000301 /LENGTH=471 /DNA_ID=CAMNT_0010841421 /DNA_START=18 /DNA_END=1430 /DNA_ORIENTATION=+
MNPQNNAEQGEMNENELDFNYIDTGSVVQNNQVQNTNQIQIGNFGTVGISNNANNERNELNSNNIFEEIFMKSQQLKDKMNKKTSKRVCRICYCNEEEMNDTLIQPCDCSGSMRYIHYSCLQQWLKSRSANIKKSTTTSASGYFLKTSLDCELCKKSIPDRIKQKEKVFNILDFLNSGYKEYIIFESFLSSNDRRNFPQARQFYTINIENKATFKIGRGHDAHLRLNDISISRIHSVISIRRQGYEVPKDPSKEELKIIAQSSYVSISDCESKFGTLIFVYPSKIPILRNRDLSLQIGRSLVKMVVRTPFSLTKCFLSLICCNSSNKEEENMPKDYEIINHIAIRKMIDDYTSKVQNVSFSEDTEVEQSLIKSKQLGATEIKDIHYINEDNVCTNPYLSDKKEKPTEKLFNMQAKEDIEEENKERELSKKEKEDPCLGEDGKNRNADDGNKDEYKKYNDNKLNSNHVIVHT